MEKNNNKQVVQPEVSRTKFDNEVSEYRKLEDEWRKKGVICLNIEFPIIQLVFIAHQLKPPSVAFAVSIDFNNYDVDPPSIVFINPFSGKPITTKEMNVGFFQLSKKDLPVPEGQPKVVQNIMQPILMGAPDDYPFLCIPGVREYHKHPAHTGDSWLLYRNKGEGKLGFLIDQLYNHSIPFVKSYNIKFNVSINQQP